MPQQVSTLHCSADRPARGSPMYDRTSWLPGLQVPVLIALFHCCAKNTECLAELSTSSGNGVCVPIALLRDDENEAQYLCI